jgi:hypothetical protein
MPERSQWDVHKYVPPHLIFNTFLLLARWSAKFHQNVNGWTENSGEQGSKYMAQSVSEDWFLQVCHISSLSFGIPSPGLRRLEAHVLVGWPRFNSRSLRVWWGGGGSIGQVAFRHVFLAARWISADIPYSWTCCQGIEYFPNIAQFRETFLTRYEK